MFLKFQPFFIIAETPLHPGSGSELGIVDLPIQRERHTDFPKIEGSGIKGCIREAFENSTKNIKLNASEINANNKTLISLVFGQEEGNLHAGAIAFTDARILLFPVKSLKGIFVWITCPDVLERFKKDMKISGRDLNDFQLDINSLINTITQSSDIVISSKIILEEYVFEVKPDENTNKIAKWFSDNIFPNTNEYKYWRNKMAKDIAILSNEEFREFVKTSTEIVTRIKIATNTHTVEPGALWTEEYLPQDTILYSIAMTSPLRVKEENKHEMLKGDSPTKEAENVMSFFAQGLPELIQIGGNQTIGKGIARIQIF